MASRTPRESKPDNTSSKNTADTRRGRTPSGDLDSASTIEDSSLERREIPSYSDSREARIAEAAYWRAEQRGFAPGGELDDWLAAERELRERHSAEADSKSEAGSSDEDTAR